MPLRPTALGCTQIAAYAWFTSEESSEVGKPREQNHAIATGKGKQWSSYPRGNTPRISYGSTCAECSRGLWCDPAEIPVVAI